MTMPLPRFVRPLLSWSDLAALATLLLGVLLLHAAGLARLWQEWQVRPEVSHGFLVPPLALLLFLRGLARTPPKTRATPGVAIGVMAGAVAVATVGRHARVPDLEAYAFVLALAGLCVAVFGVAAMRKCWAAFVYLLFMMPLPAVLYLKLSILSQLLSSRLGTGMIEFAGVPVFRDGNLIDLGVIALQVAEACSGLAYLFPLISFGFLFAVLLRAPWWQRALLLIATIPVAIVMNALRIAGTGLLLERYGPTHAEGFMHLFEGWVIFVVCLAVLYGLCTCMLGFRRRNAFDMLDIDGPMLLRGLRHFAATRPQARTMATIGVLLATGIGLAAVPMPATAVPPRQPFTDFPTEVGPWRGSRLQLDAAVEQVLGASSYAYLSYTRDRHESKLFIAYYEAQTDRSIHLPEICIAGAGWEILAFDTSSVPTGEAAPMPVKRALIRKGMTTRLVYYWFEERGRVLTDEYLQKLYILLDGVVRGRTDGAIVRLDTKIAAGETPTQAEARLQELLLHALEPVRRFVPR